MRSTLTSACLIASLVIAATAAQSLSESPYVPPMEPKRAESAELITHATTDGQSQTLTVIEPRNRVIAVYNVDRASGRIKLQSVRNITWDLQMGDIGFNSDDPSPQDIRSGLKR